MHLRVSVVLLLSCLSLCWAQAPGDEDARCTTEHDNPPQYYDTVRPLMDSYHYTDLLPGNGTGRELLQNTAWNDYSFDVNDLGSETDNPTYWQQGAGGTCRYQVRVCGWQREGTAQDNWLITQHISKDFNPETHKYEVKIKVEVTYGVMNCRERNGCRQGFNLLHYMTDETHLPSTEGSGYMNTDNYVEFATPRAQLSPYTYNRTFTFILPPSSTGFYLAAQDTGSCLAISRMRVYRNNCKSRQIGLTKYPDAPAPRSGSVNITTSCAHNAGPVLNDDKNATCFSSGTWGPERPRCRCNHGYEDRGTECIGCPAGQYRYFEGTGCQSCPENTVTDKEAAGVCQCIAGYFRNNSRPDEDCRRPPSVPLNLVLTPQRTNTNIKIRVTWDPPNDRGSTNDLEYVVEYRLCSESDTSYTGTTTTDSTSHTFSRLQPFTQYCVRVTAQNEVSVHDPDGLHLRRIQDRVTTLSLPPGVVAGVQGLYPYVVWNPPEQPNGEITGYRLRFSRSGTSTTRTVTTDNDQTFYVIQSSDIPWTSGSFTVTVSARNSAGFGTQSSAFTLSLDECPTTQPPPTLAPPVDCPEPEVCPSRRVGLVHYPATLAADSQTSTVTVQCADNAHRTSSSLSVTCSSSGSWSGSPQCECDDGYEATTVGGIEVCRAKQPTLCPAQNVGLVRYNATLAPDRGTRGVTAQCADNAHRRTGSSLSVTCSSSGSWSGSPRCECDGGYQTATVGGRQICQAIPPDPPTLCAAQSVGLVRYPTTLAPDSGTSSVTVHCADNAHRSTGSSLSVTCSSSGSWSGSPQCECDDGYQAPAGSNVCQATANAGGCRPNATTINSVRVADIEVLGCGAISWRPPPGNEGQAIRYAVRFFDGDTYETSGGGYRRLQRYFDELGRQWAQAEDLPTDGRTVFAEIRARNSTKHNSPYSEKIQVAGSECAVTVRPTSVPCPPSPTGAGCVLCGARSVDLVRYNATLAPASGSQSVTVQCADNAHRTSSSLRVTCRSTGSWSGSPQCECDDGYETATAGGLQICQAMSPTLCPARIVDLVRYNATLAPSSGTRSVTVQCADNAHKITGSSLSVTCSSSGSWSGSPQCDCDDGYQTTAVGGRQICRAIPPPVCPARRVGLVRYPATLAPDSRTRTVTVQCADNAHGRTGSSLSVTCSSSGSWSGSPQCECDDGYQAPAGSNVCQGRCRPSTTAISSVSVADIEVLGCGAISWRPPPGNEGQAIRYAVRFFDGDTFETSAGGYSSIQRYFDDLGRHWARAENLPTDGRTVYADIRARNSTNQNSEYSGKVEVTGNTVCPTTAPCPTPGSCPVPVMCEAMSEGLVRYPATLAPDSGSQSVTVQCADNAHRTSSSPDVSCTAGGMWSDETPECECDDGYKAVTAGAGLTVCQEIKADDSSNTSFKVSFEDFQIQYGPVHLMWDTTADKSALLFYWKEGTERMSHSVIVEGKDYYRLLIDSGKLSNIKETTSITVEIETPDDRTRKQRDTSKNIITFTKEEIRKNLTEKSSTAELGAISPNSPESVIDGTAIAIAIILTFIVTAAAVGFFCVALSLVLRKRSEKKKEISATANGHYSSDNAESNTNF